MLSRAHHYHHSPAAVDGSREVTPAWPTLPSLYSCRFFFAIFLPTEFTSLHFFAHTLSPFPHQKDPSAVKMCLYARNKKIICTLIHLWGPFWTASTSKVIIGATAQRRNIPKSSWQKKPYKNCTSVTGLVTTSSYCSSCCESQGVDRWSSITGASRKHMFSWGLEVFSLHSPFHQITEKNP